MKVWSLLISLLGIMGIGVGYPDGAPPDTCFSMEPDHGNAVAMETESPYQLEVDRVTVFQGEQLMVSITGPESFRGFLLQARWADERSTEALGRFLGHTGRARPIPCSGVMATGLTHDNKRMKRRVEARWVSSRIDHGSIQFVATVVKSYDEYWVGIRSPVVTIATRSSTVAMATVGELTSAASTSSWSPTPWETSLPSVAPTTHQNHSRHTTHISNGFTTPGVSSTPVASSVSATTAPAISDQSTFTRLDNPMTTDFNSNGHNFTTTHTPFANTIRTTEKGILTTTGDATQLPRSRATGLPAVDVMATMYRTQDTKSRVTTLTSTKPTDDNSTVSAATNITLPSPFLNTTETNSFGSSNNISTKTSNTMAPFDSSEASSVGQEPITTKSSTTLYADNSSISYHETSTSYVEPSTGSRDVLTTHFDVITSIIPSTAAPSTSVNEPPESPSTTVSSSESTTGSTPNKITSSEAPSSSEYTVSELLSSVSTRKLEITSTSMPTPTITPIKTETTLRLTSTNLPSGAPITALTTNFVAETATHAASPTVNAGITTVRVIVEEANEIRMRLRITDIPFTESLRDSTSDEFKNVAGQIAKGIRDLYTRQGVRTLRSVNVLRITRGSIIPEIQMIASETFNDSSKSAWLRVTYNELEKGGRLGNINVSDMLAVGADGTFRKVDPCFLLPCPPSMNCNVSEGTCKSTCLFNTYYCLNGGVCKEPLDTMQLVSCRCDQNHEGERCDVRIQPVTPLSGENIIYYVVAAICGSIVCLCCVIIVFFLMFLIRKGRRKKYWRRTTGMVSNESGLISISNGRDETSRRTHYLVPINSGALIGASSDVGNSRGEISHATSLSRVASFSSEQPRLLEGGVHFGQMLDSLNGAPERGYELESNHRPPRRRSVNFSDVVEMSAFAALENFSIGSRELTGGNFQMRWDFHIDRSDSREFADL